MHHFSKKMLTVVIASAMGARALDIFAQKDIKGVVGASALAPEELVKQYLDNTR